MKQKPCQPLNEAARLCGLSPDIIIQFVSFEWIVPSDWQHQMLDEEDIARARLIWELREEFGVNDEAVPIILHLIDQLNWTHLEVKKRTKQFRLSP